MFVPFIMFTCLLHSKLNETLPLCSTYELIAFVSTCMVLLWLDSSDGVWTLLMLQYWHLCGNHLAHLSEGFLLGWRIEYLYCIAVWCEEQTLSFWTHGMNAMFRILSLQVAGVFCLFRMYLWCFRGVMLFRCMQYCVNVCCSDQPFDAWDMYACIHPYWRLQCYLPMRLDTINGASPRVPKNWSPKLSILSCC